jgi:hypothetical protein
MSSVDRITELFPGAEVSRNEPQAVPASREEPTMTDHEPGGQQSFPDLGGLLAQAQQMQEKLMAAQADAANAVVEGSAGGGAVTIAYAASVQDLIDELGRSPASAPSRPSASRSTC